MKRRDGMYSTIIGTITKGRFEGKRIRIEIGDGRYNTKVFMDNKDISELIHYISLKLDDYGQWKIEMDIIE